MYGFLSVPLSLILLSPALGNAAGRSVTITVRAVHGDYREAPVSLSLDAPRDFAGVTLKCGGETVPAQTRPRDGRTEVVWIVRNLLKGESRQYTLTFDNSKRPASNSGVVIDRSGANLDIRINNALVTRYDTTTGPNKPYFYPLFGPGGKRMVRGYPIEELPGETKDHPHHRGLWFTHGDVNGGDFWSEGARAARTVHRRYEEVNSGPVYGYFRAITDWIGTDGVKVAEDTREVRVYNVEEGRLLDFSVVIRAVDKPVVFGDTKEGSFGLRLPDAMRVRGGTGHIETARGDRDAAAWGKRAEWVDYYGLIDGVMMGVAILDHPTNFRHPTYWHVRDYGLFAANPFGIHDFTGNRANPTIGNHTLSPGETLTFRYRIFLHKGTTEEAHIRDVWRAFADPPQIEVH